MAGAWTDERRKAASETQRRLWQERRVAAGIPDELVCTECGKGYVAPLSQTYSHRTGRRFCSMACRNAAMRAGKVFKRGAEHHAWKGGAAKPVAARARAQKIWNPQKEWCERCGFMLATEIHHIDKDVYNNERENIELLCDTCHDVIHAAAKPPSRRRASFERDRPSA